MPIVRLVAEGVGPFDHLDTDFSDGKGNPHLGPHILAGVNGSGKSTVLRTIAWVLSCGEMGFPEDDWRLRLTGRFSRCVLLDVDGERRTVKAVGSEDDANLSNFADAFAKEQSASIPDVMLPRSIILRSRRPFRYLGPQRAPERFVGAGYVQHPAVEDLPNPDLTKNLTDPKTRAFAFEKTVSNENVHAWLIGLLSKSALASKSGQSPVAYDRAMRDFENALRKVYQWEHEEEMKLEVDLEPTFRLLVRIRGQRLNFSQIPGGVSAVVGWLADFKQRQDLAKQQSAILLIDEIDAHLHPRWQRQILPALRDALPEVQIIVATHSPFVITSCKDAKVHVLEVNEHTGRASLRESLVAPFGQSFNAALKDIFGVDSSFDLTTENELNEWNELKKKETTGQLSGAERAKLEDLSRRLGQRSEELRMIVDLPGQISTQFLGLLK